MHGGGRRFEPGILHLSVCSSVGLLRRCGSCSGGYWFQPTVRNERSRRLAKLFSAIALEKNRKWIGWTGKAVVSEAGKKSGYCARNFAYKPIVIHPDAELLGRTVTVRITGATRNDLRGEVIASC